MIWPELLDKIGKHICKPSPVLYIYKLINEFTLCISMPKRIIIGFLVERINIKYDELFNVNIIPVNTEFVDVYFEVKSNKRNLDPAQLAGLFRIKAVIE